MSQQSAAATVARRIPVVVGFDFGTHSTKILMRRRGDDIADPVYLDAPTEGFPWFASPSLVQVAKGKLYFGRQALEVESGEAFSVTKSSTAATDGGIRGSPC